MTTSGLLHWLMMHDVRLSACGERLLVDAPKGVLADRLVAELREHKAGLLAIIRESGDSGDTDRTIGSGPGSVVLSPTRANSGATADELPPWADPTNADVRITRAKPRRLGVLDVRLPANPGLAEARCRWVVGAALNRLPEQLQGLVVEREGRTPEDWACELKRRAGLCAEPHSDTAERYRRAADLLRRRPNGRRTGGEA